MHPLCDAIDEFIGEVQLHGFGKPILQFPTWEDGMVLMIRAGLTEEASTPFNDHFQCFSLNGTLIIFPLRCHSKTVSDGISELIADKFKPQKKAGK